MISLPLLWILYITLLDLIRQFKSIRYLFVTEYTRKQIKNYKKNKKYVAIIILYSKYLKQKITMGNLQHIIIILK